MKSKNKKLRRVIVIVNILLVSFFSVNAQLPKIGDKAPSLYIIKWLKGKPVSHYEKGKVYLIEFGYVACPPCRKAIPHLSEIARKYRKGGKVEVVSVFTAESNINQPSDLSYIKNIQKLSDFMGDKMDYTIAVDVPTQKTNKAWGSASGFPFIFIVNQEGKIATQRLSVSPEVDVALESIVNTGQYNAEAYLEKTKKEADSLYNRSTAFDKQQELLKEKGDYKEMIRALDSALAQTPVDKKENLLFQKFNVILMQMEADSTAADKCLEEIVINKKDDWQSLHAKFQNLVPPQTDEPFHFNINRYLEIADRAIAEVGIPFLQAMHLGIKANIIFECTHDKAATMAILNKALELVKETGIAKDIRNAESNIQLLEEKDKRLKMIDADWKQFQEALRHPTEEEFNKVQMAAASSGNTIPMHQYLYQNTRKQLELAEHFLNKYPNLIDYRVYQALYRYLEGNNLLQPWLGNITPEMSVTLVGMMDSLMVGYKSQPQRELNCTAPWDRAIPRDEQAEKEWIRKGNEFVERIKNDHRTTAEDKESLDWAIFVRDWHSAARVWRSMPREDERIDDNINKLESDFWKRAAAQYWELYWRRFKDHLEKYIELPIIPSRAPGFLSGGLSSSPELVVSYWEKIRDQYGDPKHPLAGKETVQALYKAAVDQLHIESIKQRLAPVDMKFTALDGRQVDLTNYRGKLVLIDFWASWCKPCVGEMPALKAVYDKYHDKGFEMIGICMDNESKRESVKNLLAKNSLIGPQRFEGVGFNNDRYKQLYGIFGLPTVWLLDKEGVLISTHARGKELEELLEKYLGTNK